MLSRTDHGPGHERGRTTAPDWQPEPTGKAHTIFLDLDTVLLSSHKGRRGVELGVQADLNEGIDRLSEIADHIVVLVYPQTPESGKPIPAQERIDVLRESLGSSLDNLLLATCPHGDAECDCAKPGSGLIKVAIEEYDLPGRGGWYIGADQEGVVAGRGAGLHTVRIGPLGEDHLSSVHRPDYEARDLLDAANHVLMEELT